MPQTTDPTFYRSPGEAIAAPPERLAYVAAYDPAGQAKDAMAVLDVDPSSDTYGKVVGWSRAAHRRQRAAPLRLERLLQRPVPPGPRRPRPAAGAPLPDRPRHPLLADLCAGHQARPAQPQGRPRHHGRGAGRQGRLLPAPHRPLRPRRHLRVQPGRRQRQRRPRRGRPARPRHLRRHRRLGARPRRPVLRLRRLVAPQLRHHDHLRVGHPLDVRERPQPRGPAGPAVRPPPQLLDACPSAPSPSASTWATPTSWCSRSARPTTRPRPGGSSGVVISVEDLSGSVWLWHRDGDRWAARKVITIPAEPADPDLLPPALKPFGAVPPLISDIDLSVDDRWLYVSCWGTGELKQYDVSDIFHPRETGSVKLGGIVRPPAPPGRARPAAGWRAADGRGQPRRPPGLCHQLAVRGLGRHLLPRRRRRLGGQARRRPGRRRASALDARFFPNGDDFRGLRVHQTRLQAGDASSDSYCHTS